MGQVYRASNSTGYLLGVRREVEHHARTTGEQCRCEHGPDESQVMIWRAVVREAAQPRNVFDL